MKAQTRYELDRAVEEAEIEALEDQEEAIEIAAMIERDRQIAIEKAAEEEAEYWRSVEREFYRASFDEEWP